MPLSVTEDDSSISSQQLHSKRVSLREPVKCVSLPPTASAVVGEICNREHTSIPTKYMIPVVRKYCGWNCKANTNVCWCFYRWRAKPLPAWSHIHHGGFQQDLAVNCIYAQSITGESGVCIHFGEIRILLSTPLGTNTLIHYGCYNLPEMSTKQLPAHVLNGAVIFCPLHSIILRMPQQHPGMHNQHQQLLTKSLGRTPETGSKTRYLTLQDFQ